MKCLTWLLNSIMLYALTCRVTIGNVEFTSVNDLVINHSIHSVVQRAKIRIPLSARLHHNGEITSVSTNQVFKPGDPVSIELGYNGQLYPEFNGYVTRLVYGRPMTIECEDAMYIVRKNTITHEAENVKLKTLTDMCLKGLYNYAGEVPDMVINQFSVKDESAVEILQTLKNDYGLGIYFTPQAKLWCGGLFDYRSVDVKYNFHTNINPVRNELKHQEAEDVKLRIIGKSWKRDGSIIEASEGSEDGSVRTFWYYGIEDSNQLKERVLAEVGRYRFSGYTGYFQTFLYPYAEPGMKAIIEDPDFPERGGSYYIESVETRFGLNGASRKIEPGIKLD